MPGVGVEFGGAAQFTALARRLEEAAGRGAVTEAAATALDHILPDAQKAVQQGCQRLPQRNGLGRRVAQTKLSIRITRNAETFGIKIVAEKNAVADPGAINRGRVRHKVWGREPKKVLIQRVEPGWFSDPLQEMKPDIQKKLLAAISDALGRI